MIAFDDGISTLPLFSFRIIADNIKFIASAQNNVITSRVNYSVPTGSQLGLFQRNGFILNHLLYIMNRGINMNLCRKSCYANTLGRGLWELYCSRGNKNKKIRWYSTQKFAMPIMNLNYGASQKLDNMYLANFLVY